jgi:hypothetical protein
VHDDFAANEEQQDSGGRSDKVDPFLLHGLPRLPLTERREDCVNS